MKVRLAKTAGFCMGVKRAVDRVLEVAQRGSRKVYTYGPLIHNPQAVRMIEQRGAVAREEFTEPEDATVVIRAHGVPPKTRQHLESLGLEVVDATCPHVLASQKIIRQHWQKGYQVIIVGDRDHAEVAGLLGYCDGQASVISTIRDAYAVPLHEPVCVVAQTTFEESLYEQLAAILRERARRVKVIDSICRATNERQEEVRQLAAECDCVVVVGGRYSANTRRLAEIAAGSGVPAFHVETADELNMAELSRFALIGVTAGASTPSWITREVIERIERFGEDRRGVRALMRAATAVASLSNLSAAAAAFALTYASQVLQNLPEPHWPHATIAFSYVFFVYTLNLARTLSQQVPSKPGRAAFYTGHRVAVWTLSAPLVAASLVLAWQSNRWTVLPALVAAYMLGSLYDVPFWRGRRCVSLRDITASKDLLVACAWTFVAAVLPILGQGWTRAATGLLVTGFVFSLSLFRTLEFDLADLRADRILGAEALPVVVGETASRRLAAGLLAACGILLALGWATDMISALSLWHLVALCPLAFYTLMLNRGRLLSDAASTAFLDGTIFLIGVAALGWKIVAT